MIRFLEDMFYYFYLSFTYEHASRSSGEIVLMGIILTLIVLTVILSTILLVNLKLNIKNKGLNETKKIVLKTKKTE